MSEWTSEMQETTAYFAIRIASGNMAVSEWIAAGNLLPTALARIRELEEEQRKLYDDLEQVKNFLDKLIPHCYELCVEQQIQNLKKVDGTKAEIVRDAMACDEALDALRWLEKGEKP